VRFDAVQGPVGQGVELPLPRLMRGSGSVLLVRTERESWRMTSMSATRTTDRRKAFFVSILIDGFRGDTVAAVGSRARAGSRAHERAELRLHLRSDDFEVHRALETRTARLRRAAKKA